MLAGNEHLTGERERQIESKGILRRSKRRGHTGIDKIRWGRKEIKKDGGWAHSFFLTYLTETQSVDWFDYRNLFLIEETNIGSRRRQKKIFSWF